MNCGKESYNFRVKVSVMLYLFVDGRELCFRHIVHPASRIGFCSRAARVYSVVRCIIKCRAEARLDAIVGCAAVKYM